MEQRQRHPVIKTFSSSLVLSVSSNVIFYGNWFLQSEGISVAFSALTLLVGQQEGHLVCKKYGGWWRRALVSPDGVAPSRMVSVPASVNLPLCHKVQKFSSGTGSAGWSQKKGRKTVVVVVWWWGYISPKNCLSIWSLWIIQLFRHTTYSVVISAWLCRETEHPPLFAAYRLWCGVLCCQSVSLVLKRYCTKVTDTNPWQSSHVALPV